MKPENSSNAPVSPEPKQAQGNSKLASRFNPGLAAMLAKGPPSQPQSRNASPGSHSAPKSRDAASSRPSAAGAPLQDVRKDRAKGPKRRKAATQPSVSTPEEASLAEPNVKSNEVESSPSSPPEPTEAPSQAPAQRSDSPSIAKTKVGPPPGSVASIMTASLVKASRPSAIDLDQSKSVSVTSDAVQSQGKSSGPVGSLVKSLNTRPKPLESATPQDAPAGSAPATDVPEFKGFSAAQVSRTAPPAANAEEDKENGESLPSVKAAASLWGRRSSPVKKDLPAQISVKDEEAAMRSAELLAGNSSPSSSVASNRSGLPSKPAKPSRVVSGQLAEASANKGQ